MGNEKNVIAGIVVLIFVVVIALAILISTGETPTGTVIQDVSDFPEAQQDFGKPEVTESDSTVEVVKGNNYQPPAKPYDPKDSYLPPTNVMQGAFVLTPFEAADAYYRAKSLVERSECFHRGLDFRELTFYTESVGTKYVTGIFPLNPQHSAFSATIVGYIQDSKRVPVQYFELQVEVDIAKGQVTSCGTPQEVAPSGPLYYYR